MSDLIEDWKLRRKFADRLSQMYREEVPAYGELVDLVGQINAEDHSGSVRLGEERHGAIRLAHPKELKLIRRALRLLGMHPVGYYDLSPAGLPVHSTAFRPLTSESMEKNAFRIFTSLVRLDQIGSERLKAEAKTLVNKRSILSSEALLLIEVGERYGGLTEDEGEQFITALMDTFRWRGEALASHSLYEAILGEHPLLADVVCFPNPHINHLTPRVVDIDKAQDEMIARGLPAKAKIEGPPKRKCPVLLRQTAFRALDETVFFPAGENGISGLHTARFGEIESRGAALTTEGMRRYNPCRASSACDCLPDDWNELREQGLAWFSYETVDATGAQIETAIAGGDVNELVRAGALKATPITYEDFLPVSAAGIFRSNLKEDVRISGGQSSNQTEFEDAMGSRVHDAQALYRLESDSSLKRMIRESEGLMGPVHG